MKHWSGPITAAGAVAVAFTVGGLVAFFDGTALLFPAMLAILIAVKRPQLFSSLLVISTFLSRVNFDVSGFVIRPEIALSLAAGAGVLFGGPVRRRLGNTVAILLLCAWIAWLVIVSIYFSPSFGESLSIALWLTLDVVAVVYIVTRVPDPRRLVTVGLVTCLISQVVAILCWVGATFMGYRLWVQPDPAYGGYSAHAGVLEANILAGLTVLWAAIAQSRTLGTGVPSNLRTAVTFLIVPTAIVTHTRAALIAAVVVIAYATWRSRKSPLLLVVVPSTIMFVWLVVSTTDIAGLNLDKFTQLADLQGGTGRYRAVTWTAALGDLRADAYNWVHGLGLNSFGQRHLDPSMPGSGKQWYLGNLAVQLIYDGGIVAVILLGGVALSMLARVNSVGVWVFLLSYLIIGLSTSTLWLMQSWIFLALAFIYSAHGGGMRQHGGSSQESHVQARI